MGQTAKNARRGGTRWAGKLPPMGKPDWYLDTITSSSMKLHWPTLKPVPATYIRALVVVKDTGSLLYDTITNANPVIVGGLAAGTAYTYQVAWSTAAEQLSELGDVKVATTLP